MRRRDLLSLTASAASLSVLGQRAAHAQQPARPVVGYLSGNEQMPANVVNGFLKGLGEAGFVDGRNVSIEYRGSDQYGQLPTLVAEFVRRQVAVIFTIGSPNAALAAKAATTTIPIVFANSGDPVELGLVASMNRPGGNVTGVTFFAGTLVPKRLEILLELVPNATTIGFLSNPTNARTGEDRTAVVAAARSIGRQVSMLNASTPAELDAAFTEAARQRLGAVFVNGDGYYTASTTGSPRSQPNIASLPAMRRGPRSMPAA
jgi:putative ABC transport system substrate-binding protein